VPPVWHEYKESGPNPIPSRG